MRFAATTVLIAVMIGMPLTGQPGHAASNEPLTMTISGPDTATAGDRVLIRIVLKNVSDQPFQIYVGGRYTIVVHDEGGKTLPQKPGEWAGSAGYISIEPDKTFTGFVDLSNEFDLSVPGKYIVQLSRPLIAGDPKSPIVKSNDVTITVLPKKPDAP